MPLMAALAGLVASACDCDECGGYPFEIVDARTGDPIADAEAVVAQDAFARRFPVDGVLDPGVYRLWVRADGYRQHTERVDLALRCADEDGGCNLPTYTVALEPR